MAARRHDAHTTRTPQAMVPATVIPQTRCPRCTYFFLGPPGSLCPSCGGVGATTAPDSPVTDAEASVLVTQALDALPPDLERRHQDLGRRMAALERQIAGALEEVSRLRQSVYDLLDAEGGAR
jgi:hypothetical protein